MLNPYHLKYFCDSARSKSISESARRNFISHSAVSQAIRSLETALDTSLLVHAKRRFELTAQGEALYAHAERVLNELEALPLNLQDARQPSGPLRLGFSQSLWNGALKKPLSAFFKAHAKVQPSVLIGNSSSLVKLLSNREIDLGFGIEDGSFVRMERTFLASGQFVLAHRKNLKQNNRYLVGDKGNEASELATALAKRAVKPEMISVQSWTLTTSLAASGVGTGLIPDFCLKSDSSLVQVEKKIKLPSFEISAFYRTQTSLSLAARELILAVQTEIGRG